MSKKRNRYPTLSEVLQTVAPAAPAAPAPVNQERLYVVEAEARVKRGSTYYTLPKGKVISSFGFDVDELLAAGVALTPCDATPPSS